MTVPIRRTLLGPAAPRVTFRDEIAASILRFVSNWDIGSVRAMQRLMDRSDRNRPGKPINTEAFHSLWFGAYEPSEPDLTLVFFIHGAAPGAVPRFRARAARSPARQLTRCPRGHGAHRRRWCQAAATSWATLPTTTRHS